MRVYKKKRDFLYASAFLSMSLIGIVVFYGWAFMIVLHKSFVTFQGKYGISNYIEVLENKAFWLAMKNTGCFMAACIPLLLILSLAVALILKKVSPLNQFLKKGFLIPLAIPASAVIFLWNLLLDNHGILNGMIAKMGLSQVNWMDSKGLFWILVVIFLWKNLGYYVILWVTALCQIPQEIYEAARIDGAGKWRIFVNITVPQLQSAGYYIILFSIISGFRIFREIYIVAGDYPGNNIYMIQHLLSNWYRDMDVSKLSAATILLVGIIMIMVSLIKWRMKGNQEEL